MKYIIDMYEILSIYEYTFVTEVIKLQIQLDPDLPRSSGEAILPLNRDWQIGIN